MIHLTVHLAEDWVQAQAEKGVRALRAIERWARSQEGVKLRSSDGRGRAVFTMEDARRPSFAAALEAELSATLGAEDPAKVVTYAAAPVSVRDAHKQAEKESARAVPKPAPKPASKSAPRPAAASGDEAKGEAEDEAGDEAEDASEPRPQPSVPSSSAPANTAAPAARAKAEAQVDDKAESGKPEDAKPDPQSVLAALLDEVPARDSRPIADILREAATVVPMLQRMGAMGSFWGQHLLVSMDDGYGFSGFQRAVARLYDALGLVPGGVGEKTVKDIKVDVGQNERDLYDDWDRAVATAREMAHANARGAGRVLLCLDVRDWQARLASAEVKARLRQLNAACGSFTCIFRIPCVDERALAAAEEALNDVMNVRPVVVPPVSVEDLTAYARTELAKRGFELRPESDGGFEQCLLAAKRDDSFFGYRTVDKMIDRVIYEKALSNCRAGATDRAVGPDDLKRLAAPVGGPDASPDEDLDALIGLASVKEKVREIVAQIKAQRRLAKRGRRVKRPAIHMLFTGSPGTGKTTVARLVARLLRQEGVLRKGHLVEVRGRDLCGEYVGQTAPKTSAICRDAYGSVLFIDEAYSLFRGEESSCRDYGREALDTLVAEMENHRDDLCVILAGYTDEMETMLEGNAGLKSRIPFAIDFPSYTREELAQIFFAMAKDSFGWEPPLEKAVQSYFAKLPDAVLASKDFSNARFVRNLYERIWGKAAYRSRLEDGDFKLLVSDLVGATEEREFKQLLGRSVRRPIGFGAWERGGAPGGDA